MGAGGRFLSVCLGRFLYAQAARYRGGACVELAGRQMTKPLRLLIHCYSVVVYFGVDGMRGGTMPLAIC